MAREAVKRWRGDERGGEDRRGKEMRGMRGEAMEEGLESGEGWPRRPGGGRGPSPEIWGLE